MDPHVESEVVMRIPVWNAGSTPITLTIEPLGDAFEILPSERYELVLVDPDSTVLTIEMVKAELMVKGDLGTC